MRLGRRAETLYNQIPAPGWESHKWEGNYNSRGSLQEVRCPQFPIRLTGSYNKEDRPQNIGFESQWGPLSGESEHCAK